MIKIIESNDSFNSEAWSYDEYEIDSEIDNRGPIGEQWMAKRLGWA